MMDTEQDLNPCLPNIKVYALSNLMKQLTIFTLWPAVDEMFHVHSFRLGYLSGQLGLIRVPSALLILYAQPARGQKGTHRAVIQLRLASQGSLRVDTQCMGSQPGSGVTWC